MADEKRKLAPGPDTSKQGSADKLSSDLQNLLDRARQFGKLAKTAKGQAPKLSPSQREFLSQFASQLAVGVTEDNEASVPRTAPKLARLSASRTRLKGEQ